QGTWVSEQQEFSKTFTVRWYHQAACNQVEVDIMLYRGLLPKPQWIDTDCQSYWCLPDELALFLMLCTVHVDTLKITEKLTPKHSAEGSVYYVMEVKVILLFGLTELKAVISWADGVSHQFPDDIASDVHGLASGHGPAKAKPD
ncbi:hypothetical protein EDB19DRAFT_1638935, partial [Suillus lakei]